MAISSPPPAPQRGDRATFSQRVDAFLMWLVGLPAQLNSFLSSITTLAAGGANSFSYTFDSATTDADPGTGKLRLGSATQNGAVAMRIDTTAGNGGDIAAFLTSFAAGTSNVKGSVRLQKVNDVTAYLLFDVTAVATPTGYRNLTLVPRASSAASPFVNNDTLMVFFDKNGDKGDGGNTPTAQQMRDAIGTLPIENGGTAATTAAQARANLGAKASGAVEGIATGGTGATTAAGALFALGALPKTGGDMTGNLRFANNVGLYAQDAGGTYRQQLVLASDNNTYLTNVGGQNIVFNNLAGSGVALLTNGGAFSAATVSSTSDERLKENWRDLPDDFIEQFAAIECAGLFDWKGEGRTDGGVGAQSLQRIAPWAVTRALGVLRVNHGAINTAVLHALARRVLRNERAK